MSSDVVLKIQNISKCFAMYEKPVHRLYQMLCAGHKKFYKEFWALNDISFEVHRGECVGIIGRNGAGKSTLLQIITGTLQPTTGTVEKHGRIAALLELGSGFNPEFTGRENVYMNASILGLSKEEIDARYQEILDFADIGDFINQPVKTYSSGMMVRLAFAVNAFVDPDILIVDEALAVGDLRFQMKCFKKMREFIENKEKTVIFVTHDMATIKDFCTITYWIDSGKLVKSGTSLEIVEAFLAFMLKGVVPGDKKTLDKETQAHQNDVTAISNLVPIPSDAICNGEGGALITHAGLFDENNRLCQLLDHPQFVTVVFRFEAFQTIESPHCAFHIVDRKGISYTGCNNSIREIKFPVLQANKAYVASFKFFLPEVMNGEYFILAAINDGYMGSIRLHNVVNSYHFTYASSSLIQRQGVWLKLPECNIKLQEEKC